MRINDISTFDSKPVLISQIDEILANKNVTMQGNNVNSPGGLLVLTNEGKIPENTDIQHIFYIGDTFPSADIKKNSLYVSSTGESRATDDNAEYINISLQVVTDFSTVTNDTLATTQAISAFVDEKISNIDIPSTDLSNYYNKTESDEKFALKDDVNSKLALSVVEDFPTSGINNTLYVNNENHAQIYANDQWKDIAIEVVENFDTPSQTTVPTTEAVSSFVDEKISNIDIPSTDLSNYYTKTEADDKYALKTAIPDTSSFITNSVSNLTNYYTKIESDDKYALKTAIPSLSGYYTKTESDDKYALKTEINNPEQKTEVTTNSIAFKKNISIYKIEVANATTFTFDFSQLDENNCYTFELWVSMSTPVTLTFPSEAAWLNDEVPDMSEISTYCIVVRKLPSTMGTSTITSPKALLNLAYQYPLVLG